MITICYPQDIQRRNNSRNGNPSYRVKIMGDWYTTKADASFAYGICLSDIGKRHIVEYHKTPTGRLVIDNMERN